MQTTSIETSKEQKCMMQNPQDWSVNDYIAEYKQKHQQYLSFESDTAKLAAIVFNRITNNLQMRLNTFLDPLPSKHSPFETHVKIDCTGQSSLTLDSYYPFNEILKFVEADERDSFIKTNVVFDEFVNKFLDKTLSQVCELFAKWASCESNSAIRWESLGWEHIYTSVYVIKFSMYVHD